MHLKDHTSVFCVVCRSFILLQCLDNTWQWTLCHLWQFICQNCMNSVERWESHWRVNHDSKADLSLSSAFVVEIFIEFIIRSLRVCESDLWWPGRSSHPWRLSGWCRPCPGCRSCKSSGLLRRTCPPPSPWRSPGGPGTGPSGPPSVCPSPCPGSTPCGRSHTAAPLWTRPGRSHCNLPPPHCWCCQTELTLKDTKWRGWWCRLSIY